jgi:hypothetical protein
MEYFVNQQLEIKGASQVIMNDQSELQPTEFVDHRQQFEAMKRNAKVKAKPSSKVFMPLG